MRSESPGGVRHIDAELLQVTPGLHLGPCTTRPPRGSREECALGLLVLCRFRAQRKVSCTPRAWHAPMGLCAAGGWGPGALSSASSTPPTSSLCSWPQVDTAAPQSACPEASVLPPADWVNPCRREGLWPCTLPLPQLNPPGCALSRQLCSKVCL